MNNTVKAKTIELVGKRLTEVMEERRLKAACFDIHPLNKAPLGVPGLESIPVAWFDEVRVLGFVVERVGKNSIRIW